MRTLPAGATHADLAVAGRSVAVAWKRFDGNVTKIESLISNDAGQTFAPGPSLQTAGDSDQPRLVNAGQRILLVWRNADGIAVRDVAQRRRSIRASSRSLATRSRRSSAQHARTPFWLVLWDLECPYCMKSLSHLAAAQRSDPQAESRDGFDGSDARVRTRSRRDSRSSA